MPRYEVTAWVGMISRVIDADNEDAALTDALDTWGADDVFERASYEVRELSD